MRRLRKVLLVAAVLGLALVVLVFLAHPYLAVTAPVEAEVAVVEGWMPSPRMAAVKSELERRGYDRVYTTGTVRSFSYYLRNGASIELRSARGFHGAIKINVSGIRDAGFALIADDDTIAVRPVNGAPTTYHAEIAGRAQVLLILSINSGSPPDTLNNLYIKRLSIADTNAHRLAETVAVIQADGSHTPGTPTHAHAAAAQLVALGFAPERITVVPAADHPDGRTLANAAGFAARAKVDGVERIDVISLGVHARRSRKMYRKAMGGHAEVGVIAIHDPEVAPDTWWRHRAGRYRMLKEIAGVPMSTFFDAGE